MSEDREVRYWNATAHFHHGQARAMQGATAEGITEMRAAIAQRRAADKWTKAVAPAAFAGEISRNEAMDCVRSAIRDSEQGSEKFELPNYYRMLGMLLSRNTKRPWNIQARGKSIDWVGQAISLARASSETARTPCTSRYVQADRRIPWRD